MRFNYEGEIETKDLFKKSFNKIKEEMFATTLLNPVVEIKLFNENGNELVIIDRNTNKELEITITLDEAEQHSNKNINDFLSKESFINKLPEYVLKNFSEKKLNEIIQYLIEGFNVSDVSYLVDISYIGEYYLKENIKYNPSLELRKNAWQKHKQTFNAKGKNIIFEDEILPLNYRTVPRIREEHNIEKMFRGKYRNLYKNEYNRRIPEYNNNHFYTSPIGYISEKAEYVFDLKLESQKQSLPLMQKSEISFPNMVCSNFIKYDSIPYFSEIMKKNNNNIGLYFDEELQDIFIVKDISDSIDRLNLFEENKHSYKRLSELDIPKNYLKGYFAGYEIGLHSFEILIDIKRYISDNNLKILTEYDLKTKVLIPNNKMKEIRSINKYKSGLELYGISGEFMLYRKFNAKKFNIPIYDKSHFLNEKTISVSFFELKKFEKVCNEIKENIPIPSAYVEENNLFVFSNISESLLAYWNKSIK